jgi:hypothetical protein
MFKLFQTEILTHIWLITFIFFLFYFNTILTLIHLFSNDAVVVFFHILL